MTDTLKTEREGAIAILTLNRPDKLNALDAELLDGLEAALVSLSRDPTVSCAILTGAGDKAFAAGADIAAMVDYSAMDAYRSEFITRNWETIRRVRKPVIAAVAGYAMGGGCELALACDIVVAAQSAKFALPEVKLAMLPGAGGTQRLPRAIGKAKAMDMCLSARTLDAAEADRYGLVSRVVPDAELLPAAQALAREIATDTAPVAVALTKRLLWEMASESDPAAAERLDTQVFGWTTQSPDAREGIKAFLEKRPARWSMSPTKDLPELSSFKTKK